MMNQKSINASEFVKSFKDNKDGSEFVKSFKDNKDGSESKWETVRSRNKQHIEIKKSAFNEDKESEVFIPGYIKKEIYEIINTSVDTYTKNKLIRTVIKKYSVKNKSLIGFEKKLNIFAIHTACKMNNNELVAAIIDSEIHEKGLEYTYYTNAIGSTKNNNTVLLEAAFFGSDKCMNYLITRSADLKHVNKYGEDIYKVLEQGRKYKKQLFPKTPEAIDAIFDDCVELVRNAELKVSSKETTEFKASGGAGSSNDENKFRSDYTFEILTKEVYDSLENPSKFKELVTFLKSDAKLTELLIKVLDDDDMRDNLIDYPYAIKLI